MAELCFLDQDLLNKYRAKKKVIDTFTLIVCLIWVGIVIVLAILNPEGEIDDLFLPLVFGLLLPCILLLAGIQLVWNIQKNKLFALSESTFPNDEQGNLRRRLIRLLSGYNSRFMPIVAAVYLAITVLLFILEYFLGESTLFIIVAMSLLLIPIAPILFFSMRFMRELREIQDKIQANNTPYADVENNPYKQSDVYKL